MKHAAISSMKFKRLKRRLGLPLWQVVGLLESLWQATIASAPQGDIGKFSNEDIAAWMEYEGDADELAASLTETGWLDECNTNRLVVHDWELHAPNFIKGNWKGRFAVSLGTPPRDGPLGSEYKDAPQATPPPNVTKPNVTKPNVTKPNVTKSLGVSEKPKARAAYSDAFLEFWEAFPPIRRDKKRTAYAAWKRAVARIGGAPDEAEATIQAATVEYAASPKGRSQYVSGPVPWLNGDCWDDDRASWQRGDGTQPRKRVSLFDDDEGNGNGREPIRDVFRDGIGGDLGPGQIPPGQLRIPAKHSEDLGDGAE